MIQNDYTNSLWATRAKSLTIKHLDDKILFGRISPYLLLGFLLTLLIACQSTTQVSEGTAADITQTPLEDNDACSGAFVTHELDHITTNVYEPVDMYDSNGSGVAINDLDNDGDIDIVLANLAGKNNIFWNEGNLTFRREEMAHGASRAVVTVDVDADGLLDIVFSSRVGKELLYWRNVGDQAFEAVNLPDINQHAYSMVWSDLDADGDLDVVTGSYDTALDKELRDSFMFGPGAGVFVFTNEGDGNFSSERLAETSQALTIQLLDINQDGRDDILIGNDFYTVRDYVYLASDDGWVEAEPFGTTTENTMSFDIGDINNDGSVELFATDMHPYSDEQMPDYMPMMEAMMASHTIVEGDPQVMSNVMQVRDANGTFVDDAARVGVGSTGWSWSTKFGDLDQDGFLDLYSVNGMVSYESFGYLPNNTLVEENQVLRNDGSGNFAPAPEWKLNLTAGGRGMSMADLDNDGDLDIVVNNLLDKAYLLENQLCEGNSLQLQLSQPNTQNTYAIGAIVKLKTSIGELTRDVRSISGYLSGDASRIHFGLPEDATIDSVEITWPDGAVSQINNIELNHILEIARQ